MTPLAILVGLCAVYAVWLPAVLLFNGWVLTWLWQWFAVPHGVHALSLPHAIGLYLLVGLLAGKFGAPKDNGLGDILFRPFHAGSIALVAGWIVTWFLS